MSKFAFVFPGQGTHYVGMGMELADCYPQARAIFDQASEVLGMDIGRLCRNGPDSELVKTENSQPTIHTTSLAILKVVEHYGFSAQVAAGFSLGEYAALVYAGALRFEDTVGLVRQRGLFMQAAVPQGLGKMCLISGLDRSDVEQIVADAGAATGELIECSNFNCPGQIIVAGQSRAVDHAALLANSREATTNFLKVSGPFHTSLLTGAGQQLHQQLSALALGPLDKKVPSNVTAQYYTDRDDIRQLLDEHVYKAVRWEECVATMLNDGVDTFVEIGPKRSLTTYNEVIARARGVKARCLNIENIETLEFFLRVMEKAR